MRLTSVFILMDSAGLGILLFTISYIFVVVLYPQIKSLFHQLTLGIPCYNQCNKQHLLIAYSWRSFVIRLVFKEEKFSKFYCNNFPSDLFMKGRIKSWLWFVLSPHVFKGRPLKWDSIFNIFFKHNFRRETANSQYGLHT